MWENILKAKDMYQSPQQRADYKRRFKPLHDLDEPKVIHGELPVEGKEGTLSEQHGKGHLITLNQYNALDREGKRKSHANRATYYNRQGNIKHSRWHKKMADRMRRDKRYIAPYNQRHEDTYVHGRKRTVPKVEEGVPDIFGPQGEMRPFGQQMQHERKKKEKRNKHMSEAKPGDWSGELPEGISRPKPKQFYKPVPPEKLKKVPPNYGGWKDQLKERPRNYDKIKAIVDFLDKTGQIVNQGSIRREFPDSKVTGKADWTMDDKRAIDYILNERKGDE